MFSLRNRFFVLLLCVFSFLAFGCSSQDTQQQVQVPQKLPDVIVPGQDMQGKKPLVPYSSMYRYPSSLDDENVLPPFTPEVVRLFESQAEKFKLAPKDLMKECQGVWTFVSPPQRHDSGADVWVYRFEAELAGHHGSVFVNSKGQKTLEQHKVYMEIVADRKDDSVKSLCIYTFDMDKNTGLDGLMKENCRVMF